MKRVLLRADDLGYSTGVNMGIAEAVRFGLVKSVNIMVNMPMADEGIRELKGENVCLGLHCNISNGYSLAEPAKIPSLVTEDGAFLPSRAYYQFAEDVVNLEEAVLELELQYQKFLEIVGEKPHFIDNHSVSTPNFLKAICIIANRYGLKLCLGNNGDISYVGKSRIYTICESDRKDYDPWKILTERLARITEDTYLLMILHPGYLDDYLRVHSSLLENRIKDLDAACNPDLKLWLQMNAKVVSFDEL